MKREFWRQIKSVTLSLSKGLIGMIAILAVMAAGSDGPGFPWLNIAGLVVICIIVAGVSWAEERKRCAAGKYYYRFRQPLREIKGGR